MDTLEPIIHSNKRYRQSPELVNGPYMTTGVVQQYQAQGGLANQHSGSDQSSGSDIRSGSDPSAGAMSRSVSDSSLALSGHDSRSSGGNMMQAYAPSYHPSDVQNQHLQLVQSQTTLPNGVMQSSSMVPFQENPSSTNRGPPVHLNPAFALPNSQMTQVNGCMSTSSLNGALSGGHMTASIVGSGPLTTGPLSNGAAVLQSSQGNGFISQANGMNSSNGVVAPQGYQQNGSIPANQGTFRGTDGSNAPQNSTAAAGAPMPSVPKWEASAGNPGAGNHQGGSTSNNSAPTPTVMLEPPCAACKSLRRKCTRDCIFLPYFPRDDPDKFARVHKVFGASNVAKMLQDLPVHQREDTVASLEYEAQARVQDPVFGCVGILCLLQKQIAVLQGQVSDLQRQQGIAPRVQDGAQPTISGSQVQPTM